MESNILRKIMVATDGSELVKRAVEFAVEIARLSGAKIYAVYVIEPWASISNHPRAEGWDAITYVENVGSSANVEVKSKILNGDPAKEILDFAKQKDIDLIVMGTHGKTGLEKFLMGSISENVVRHSEKAVLVVRGESSDLLFKAL